jgi:hypothetical protein
MCEFSAGGKRPARLPRGRRSGSQEDVTPTAAEKGENGAKGDESHLRTADRAQAGHPSPADRGSYRSQGWDPGGLLMGA